MRVFALGATRGEAEAALGEWRASKERESEARMEGKRVDRRQLAENAFNREMLLGNTFGGGEAAKAAVEEHKAGKESG